MRKLFALIIFWPALIAGQYNAERTTEQSFQESELYFTSHYLNPFGILNFKKVSPGLIDNPFLNLYLNPANLPGSEENSTIVYFDFRGDRTEAPLIQSYIMPSYYSRIYFMPYIDPRYISKARSEPEPVVSFGVLSYPFKDINYRLFIGGTFQLVKKNEKFYTMPYWIYNPNYYLNAFNSRAEVQSDIPVKERYAGKDDMTTEGSLYSIFAGYKINEEFIAGISINGIVYKREGGYLNLNSDEYGNTNDNEWSSSSSQGRTEKYHHTDISAGINYSPRRNLNIGIKGGILNGISDQYYNSGSMYLYQYLEPEVTPQWYISNSTSSTVQSWNHKGETKYMGFNFSGNKESPKVFSGYYRYTWSDVSLTSTSVIFDTSFYSGRWISSYDSSWSKYSGNSYTEDNRHGTGNRTFSTHEVMLNFKWNITSSNTVYLGVYLNSTDTEINDSEPVNTSRFSGYNYTGSGSGGGNYSNYLFEDKRLEWKYTAKYRTLQIPVIIDFRINNYWNIMLGINRILNDWEISDKTTAYFKTRQAIDNGIKKIEENFGESYTQPSQKITEDFIKIFTNFEVRLSPEFKIRLLIDPDFEGQFRIAQWWLGFEALM